MRVPTMRLPQSARRCTVEQARIRIELGHDLRDGWTVTRNRVVDGCFNSLEAAYEYASRCARRAHRAGMAVDLVMAPPAPPQRRAG
jgi:hypothetical protein